MAKFINAACVAGVLAVGLLGAITAARADEPLKKRAIGDAPSPEMNTLLGFLVVAGTVAFIRRRSGNKPEAEDGAS